MAVVIILYVLLQKLCVRRHLLDKSQQSWDQNNVWNMFKVYNNNSRTSMTPFWCFQYKLWADFTRDYMAHISHKIFIFFSKIYSTWFSHMIQKFVLREVKSHCLVWRNIKSVSFAQSLSLLLWLTFFHKKSYQESII